MVPPLGTANSPARRQLNATATFDQPGTYVLRWHASDGALWKDQDITVTVVLLSAQFPGIPCKWQRSPVTPVGTEYNNR